MSNGQATFGIDIVANDKTAKGKKSAEKNLGQIPKNLGAVNKRQTEASERAATGSARKLIRTFGQVESSFAKAFGGRSVTAGFTKRIGGITEAASAAGSGLGEAAAAGGVLETALGGVTVAAGATVGVLAAAAYGAFKLADGWAKGGAAIGRTAEIIGVGAKALQEFTAAGERAGLDKATSGAAIGGLSQTLNDARYGRNSGALAVLSRLGVSLKTNADGTVDVAGMMPAIADALARQNSSGRRTAARALGIPEAALPVFTQGGKALSADMADADEHASVLSDEDIAQGKRIARKSVRVGQLADRAATMVSGAVGRRSEGAYDAVLSGGQSLIDGANEFTGTVRHEVKPAAQLTHRAAERMDHAAARIERAAGQMGSGAGGAIGLTREVVAAAQAGERKYGIPASVTLAQYGLESGWGRHMPIGSNNPFGIKARAGEPYVNAMTTEVIGGKAVRVMQKFRAFASLAEAFEAHDRLLATGRPYASARAALPDVGRFADELGGGSPGNPRYATDPNYGRKIRNIISSQGLGQFDGTSGRQLVDPIPVKVEIDMRGAPGGTRVKVRAGNPAKPAISHSMAPVFQPVHGG